MNKTVSSPNPKNKLMKKLATLFILFVAMTTSLKAQQNLDAIRQFEQQNNAIVTINGQSGVPQFIRFTYGNAMVLPGNNLNQKVLGFLQSHPFLFPYKNLESEFEFGDVKTDSKGLKTLTIKQVYNGVPVYDGLLRFHFDRNLALTAVNGNFIPNLKTNPIAQVLEQDARVLALNTVYDQGINLSGVALFVEESSLFIFQNGLVNNSFEGQHLVYQVEVRNNQDVREFVFVDAHTGEVVEQYTGMAHALDRIVYEQNTSNTAWEEGDPFPGTLTIWQQNEVVTSGHVYHFFNNVFGYESFNGSGATMITINNNPNINCPNASWNGFSTNYCDGTAADDAIAHEWGHAYTEYTSGLIYAYQAGAMNESFSDVWGETIDLINGYEDSDENLGPRLFCGNTDRWIIAEDASSLNGGNGIRDMWLPTCYGNPGKVSDTQFYCGTGDNGGVHLNSGVPNHAYALLVDGGTYNGQTISGLGLTKAAHIFWRAQSDYLTATSDFYDLADALESSCTDLLGINLEGLTTVATPAGLSGEILTMADFNELVKVLIAVELRTEPSCNYEPILAATADPCDAAINNPIFFENWEGGIGTWVATEIPSDPGTWESRNWEIETSLPDGRPGQGVFGPDPINGNCSTSLQNGILRLESPVINIPDYNTGLFEMMFVHNIATEAEWDGGNIKYSLNGGPWTLLPGLAFTANGYNGQLNGFLEGNDNPMQNEVSFTGTDEGAVSGSWGRSFVDLSSIGVTANSTLQLRWELGTDGCNGRVGWYLDDISIYNCDYSLSISESIKSSVKVYPNPSNGSFTIQNLTRLDLVKAEIYDINGRLVHSEMLDSSKLEHTVQLNSVASGVYFMNLFTQNKKEVIKLVLQ